MFCKHCNVEIEGATRTCPLCHQQLDGKEYFPIVKTTRRLKTTFTLVYSICALIVAVICLLINIFVPTKIFWSVAVVGVLLYTYILVAGTIFSKKHNASKIFLQTIAVAVLSGFLQTLTPEIKWAANYAVPLILLIGGLLLGITSLAIKRAGTYVFCMTLVAVTGLIPIVYSVIEKESILWPSIACAAVCGVILIVAVITEIFSKRGLIREEIKRKFHI
ncbi:MAG TPA: DUF6320 domain-containing protein [Clostridia bacterium]|nr:DUF6320 domain-containing protein [Clostridia bacterium]